MKSPSEIVDTDFQRSCQGILRAGRIRCQKPGIFPKGGYISKGQLEPYFFVIYFNRNVPWVVEVWLLLAYSLRFREFAVGLSLYTKCDILLGVLWIMGSKNLLHY